MCGADSLAPISHALLVTTGIAVLAGCANSSLGDNAGVSVEGQGSRLTLAWESRHPWAAQLRQQAARYHIYAQYRHDSRPVEQDLGVARLDRDGAAMLFVLPDALKAPPESAICLFVSPGRQYASLPVRLTRQTAADTATFRYPAWEVSVTARTRQLFTQREVAMHAQQVSELEQQLQAMQMSLSTIGANAPQDCERLQANGRSDTGDQPADVIAPDRQAEKAQQICVRRARNVRVNYKIDLTQLTKSLLADKSLSEQDRRRAIGMLFLQHWHRWFDQTGIDYVPEIGSSSELLPMSKTTVQALRTMVDQADKDSTRREMAARSAATGMLDGYAGCLEDVGKQLVVKHEAWRIARVNQPERDRLYTERKRAECVARFQEVAQARNDLEEARRRLADKQGEAIATKDHATGAQAISTPSGPLNQISCSL